MRRRVLAPKWVMSCMYMRIRYVTHTNESCSHSHLWQSPTLLRCMYWKILWVSFAEYSLFYGLFWKRYMSYSDVWHDSFSFTPVTWWDNTCLIRACDMTRLYMYCNTCLIHMCDMPHHVTGVNENESCHTYAQRMCSNSIGEWGIECSHLDESCHM